MDDRSIRQFFESYARSYMSFDVDGVAALYEVPFLAVREGRAIHLVDRSAVRGHLSGLMEAYRNAGAAAAAIAGLSVVTLDRTSALATVRWEALSGDGRLVRSFSTSYQLLEREPDGYRILSYTYHQD